MVSRRRI